MIEAREIIKELDKYANNLNNTLTKFSYYGKKDFIMDNLTTIFINNIKKYGFDCPNSKNFLLVILKTIFDLIDNHNVISDTAFKNIFDKMWHNLTSQFNELCQEEAQTSLFEMTNDNFAQYKNNHLPDNLNQEHCHSNYFADITLTPEPNFFTDWTINSII